MQLPANTFSRLINPRFKVRFVRYINIGDKIPVNYIKDVPAPTVLENKDYPEWLFRLTDKMPTKVQLLKKFHEVGAPSMSTYELRRLKKLISKDGIKEKNAAALEDN